MTPVPVAADVRPSLVEAVAAVRDYLVVGPRPSPSDLLFCFGSADLRVPRRAAELYHHGLAPAVLVTGGAATPDHPTEADEYTTRLVELGVPSDRVLIERHALNTTDNVLLGMALAADHGIAVERVILVSWPLAARRCRATFGRHFPDVALSSAPSADIPVRKARRDFARIALAELDRVQAYGQAGLLVEQVVPNWVRVAADVVRSRLDEDDAP